MPPGASYRIVSSSEKQGARPEPDGVVVFNDTVWTRTGAMLTSSFPDARPQAAVLSDLPPSWSKAFQQSRVGDTVRIWYEGDAGELLVADLELLYAYSLPHPTLGHVTASAGPKGRGRAAGGLAP